MGLPVRRGIPHYAIDLMLARAIRSSLSSRRSPLPRAPRFGFVVEYVKDIEAAKRFYVEVMGLELQRVAPSFVQFDHFAIANDEPLGGTPQPELYWLVDDADAAWRELSGKAEVALSLVEKPFGKVFGIRDLDGSARYFIELAKRRPSAAV